MKNDPEISGRTKSEWVRSLLPGPNGIYYANHDNNPLLCCLINVSINLYDPMHQSNLQGG